MKYIRTKDGKIINLIAYKLVLETPTLLKFEYIPNGGILFVQKENVIKQADTIEELCDIGVLDEILGTLGRDTFWNEHFTISKEQIIKNKQTLYGAIWTDKGLIYVAKMNEKGELELL